MAARRVPADLAAAMAAARGRVPIQKLPAGKAEGAGDIYAWASNRLAGRGGVTRRPLTTIHCESCGHETDIDINPRHIILKCRRCQSRDVEITRGNQIHGERDVRRA